MKRREAWRWCLVRMTPRGRPRVALADPNPSDKRPAECCTYLVLTGDSCGHYTLPRAQEAGEPTIRQQVTARDAWASAWRP